jgi:hypothetical protein
MFKTAITSLNSMLGSVFWEPFCKHEILKIQKDKNVVVVTLHSMRLSAKIVKKAICSSVIGDLLI